MKTFQDEELTPWDKQPGESNKRYYAFCLYRDMGAQERSLSKVADEINVGKKPSKVRLLERWSIEGHWVKRCEGWDTEQDRKKRVYMDKALKAQARKYLDVAITAQGKGVKSLQAFNPDLEPLKPLDAMKLITEAVKLECLALGVPSDIVNIQHSGDLTVRKFQFLEEMEIEEEEESKFESSNDADAQDSQK
jgi:hypothetical protein